MPTRPLLIAIIVQNMSKEGQGNEEGVKFKAITVMREDEAEKMAYGLGLKTDSPKRVVRQEHLIIRNGVLTKLDENQLSLIASSTKIIDKFTLTRPKDDKLTSIKSIQANPDQIQQENHQPQAKIDEQSDSSIIQDFQNIRIDLDEDYCRINYEKMAIERQIGFLIQQNMIKDEIINDLRQRLNHRINLPIIEQQWRQDNNKAIPGNQPFIFHIQEAPHQIRRQMHRGGIQFNYNSTPRQGIF